MSIVVSSILEQNNYLLALIDSSFPHAKFLYDDVTKSHSEEDLKDYIYGLAKNEIILKETDKTPEKLMDEAGYILYECKNEADIQKYDNSNMLEINLLEKKNSKIKVLRK